MPDTTTLEPTPTAHDMRVLRALPPLGADAYPRPVEAASSLWQVAEAVRSEDLRDVRMTLNGLVQLGYALASESGSRKTKVWWRTAKGDAAVA